MDLILNVIRYQGHALSPAVTERVGTGGGTIGRSPEADLVLPDPNKWVGRRHARIDFRDGAFRLTDTSKNGTVVNDAAEPLREGQEIELHDGDELGIGAYEIRVSLEVAQPRPAAPLETFTGGEPALESLVQPPTGGTAPDIMQFVGGTPAGEPSSPSASPLESEQEEYLEQEVWPTREPWREEASAPRAEPKHSEPQAKSTEPNPTPAKDPFANPRSAIPDTLDIWGDEPLAQSSGSGAEAGADEPSRTPYAPDTAAVAEQPSTPPAVPAEPPRAPPTIEEGGESKALEAFFAGLGVGDLPPDPRAQAQLMRTAGELLREMTAGLIRVLMGRTSFKDHLRLTMTAIQSAGNNPFKVFIAPEDSLANLLFRPSRGYLPPVEAARNAFNDIQRHEMAIIAGLRAVSHALLAHIDPTELEKRIGDGSVMNNLVPMARKAKSWDLFTKTYEEISADAADDFLNLFKEAFRRAYEDQASRLGQVKSSDQLPHDEQ